MPHTPIRLTHQETVAFIQELDRLVVKRREIHVVVPTRPPDDSELFVRIRRCDSAAVVAAGQEEPTLPAPRQGPLVRLFHWLYRRPNYFTYIALVHTDLDPMEVHLLPR